jgi:hypothetical protein
MNIHIIPGRTFLLDVKFRLELHDRTTDRFQFKIVWPYRNDALWQFLARDSANRKMIGLRVLKLGNKLINKLL